jgi:hypothetical protein
MQKSRHESAKSPTFIGTMLPLTRSTVGSAMAMLQQR